MLEITPKDKSEWEDDEPESTANLRQARFFLLLPWLIHS